MAGLDFNKTARAADAVYTKAVNAAAVVFALMVTFFVAAPLFHFSASHVADYSATHYGEWTSGVVKVVFGILEAAGIFLLSQMIFVAALLTGLWAWFIRSSRLM